MSHLHEGVLLALRDGGVTPDSKGAEAHLETCATCREALARARDQRRAVESALSALDEPFDMEAARAAVRARVADAAAKGTGIRPLRSSARRGTQALARAAGLVLIAAAGVSALPGSPVRSWVGTIFSPDGGAVAPTEAVAPATNDVAGIRMSVTAPLRVRVLGLGAGEAVSVLWVPGREVAVFAPSGSRFGSSEDGVEAVVSHGPVRIELPTAVRPVTLEVNGRVWLRGAEAGLDFTVAPEDEEARPLRWLVPESGER